MDTLRILASALSAAVYEAMDEAVGYCQTHGNITRAEQHVFQGCRLCWEEQCRSTAKPGS